MANKRALIVDDSTTAQYRLKKMLRPYHLHIDAVDSGEAALRYLSTNAPDVIFMDHLMPGMDGFRALQIIKSHPETAMIPVIMYTAKSGDVYTGQARALGALDVVSKDTINATDLSKVMRAIHLYPDADNAVESAELIKAANQASDDMPDATYPQIDRRAPSSAGLQQARNLELRLSHLEHSLEDNRRFITSRVVRELQGLRQNIRQEFSDVLANAAPVASAPAAPTPSTETLESPPPPERSGGGLLLWIVLILLGVVLFFLVKMNSQLEEARSQQTSLHQQISSLGNVDNSTADLASPALQNLGKQQQLVAQQYANQSYLDDLTWAFNQSGEIPFTQNNLDSRVAIRAYDFLTRLIDKGFTGNVVLDLFVGDFCLLLNPLGQAELAAPDSTLGNCMLSSEAYNLNRIQDNYQEELEDSLDRIARDHADKIQLFVHAYPGPEAYPDRLPIVTAGDWNAIAQRNNRLEIHLEPSVNPKP